MDWIDLAQDRDRLWAALNVIVYPLIPDTGVNFLLRCSPCRAVNTHRLVIQTSQLMLYREIIAVCSEIHTKHINTQCGQNTEFLNIKVSLRL